MALLLFWMTGRHLSNEARRGKEKEEDDVDAFAKKGQRTTMDVTTCDQVKKGGGVDGKS